MGQNPGVLFACGAPKSGTTWLQRLLDAHPQVTCSGEGHFVDDLFRPLIKLFRDYNAHQVLVGGRVYEGRPYYSQVRQSEVEQLAREFMMQRLISRGIDDGIRWVGDKTPRYATSLDVLHRLFPEARFVAIVRDPRDAAMSRLFHARRANMPDALSAGSEDQMNVTRFGAEDWVTSVAAIDGFAAAHPGILHRLRYEDLSTDPEDEAAQLFAFLGVSTEPAVIARIMAQTSFEAQSGRPAGQEDASSHLRRGVVGDWVGRLDPAALAVVEEVCGPLMRAHHYL